jgi:hypothetical protein
VIVLSHQGDDEVRAVAMTPEEVARTLLADVKRGNAYAHKKKGLFRRSASWVMILSLSLSAASTIILGLQNLEFWGGLAFAMVALSTVINAIEPFFNWRSRWILMEEMQYRFYRLEDDLAYYLSKTPADQVRQEEVDKYFAIYQDLWHDVSKRWLEQRGLEKSKPRSVDPAG